MSDRSETPSISVLMCVYRKDDCDQLDSALRSIYNQTLMPAECVVVVDGPIPRECEAVLERWGAAPAIPMTVVRHPHQCGLGVALNTGLALCRGDYVARMDSDDICFPTRFEAQCAAIREQRWPDVVCAWSVEFEGDPDHCVRIKRTPEHHDAIARLLKWRCAVTHPTVLVRADVLRAVGGYRPDFGYLEDYDLFVRLLGFGARFYAVQAPLLYFRISPQQTRRRGGWAYARNEIAFRRFCFDIRFLNAGEYLLSTLLVVGFRLAPPELKRLLYRVTRDPLPGGQAAPGPGRATGRPASAWRRAASRQAH